MDIEDGAFRNSENQSFKESEMEIEERASRINESQSSNERKR